MAETKTAAAAPAPGTTRRYKQTRMVASPFGFGHPATIEARVFDVAEGDPAPEGATEVDAQAEAHDWQQV